MRRSPSFAMGLEGTLNQIQLQCPRRMTDLEVQQHLKDCLFHGVHKNICDSVQYLYSTPGTSYSQLMVATWKVESKNEETQEEVRARAVMTTDPREGMAELDQWIAKLMAILAKTRQGSSHSSAPPMSLCLQWAESSSTIPPCSLGQCSLSPTGHSTATLWLCSWVAAQN